MAAMAGIPTMVSGNMVLRQLHIVTRQGSPTTIIDGDSNFPVQALSTAGEIQMEQLGQWIRNHFQGNSTGLLDQYFPTRVRIDSSGHDTTIVSAQALARGLFPANSNVPVFSQAARNDITIASGDQCPIFNHQVDLLHLQQDMDWNEMEAAYMTLLKELASLPVLSGFALQGVDGPYVPLHSVWKVYDLIREAKVFCIGETIDMKICSQLTFPHAAALLTDQEWEDVKTLVRYTEVETKYGSDQSSRLLSSNLLRQIVERMADDELNTPNDPTTKRVFVSSADYPTLVALLKALSVEPNQDLMEEVIPGFGSALFVELYQDDQSYEHIVRVLYKSGGRTRATTLRMGDDCHDMGGCSLKGFTAHLESFVLKTEAWCQACENDTSDLCLFYAGLAYQEKLREAKAEATVVVSNTTTTATTATAAPLPAAQPQNVGPCETFDMEFANSNDDAFAAAFAIGLALGVVLMGLVLLIAHCCRPDGDSQRRQELVNDDVATSTPVGNKIHPKTPQTARTAQSITFWETEDEPISPTASEEYDNGDELSDEDDNNCESQLQQEREQFGGDNIHDDSPCKSLPNRAPRFSPSPSKEAFPPEIV